jgi:hypothetical protein
MNLLGQENATEYELEGPIHSTDDHAKTIQRTRELRVRPNRLTAGDLLERTPFGLYDAHNHFGYEFGALVFKVPWHGTRISDYSVPTPRPGWFWRPKRWIALRRMWVDTTFPGLLDAVLAGFLSTQMVNRG